MDWPVALQVARGMAALAANIHTDLAWRDGADITALGRMWSDLQTSFIQSRCAVRKQQERMAARKLRDMCNASVRFESTAEGSTAATLGVKLMLARTQLQGLLENNGLA